MSNITQKATVAQIPFGQNLTIEGLLLEDGSFAIAQQQVASLFQIIPTSAPKWLKSLIGASASLFQVKTDREAVEGKRVRSSESALSIKDFEKLLLELTIKQNPIAIQFTRALVGLSLTQVFSDAFGVKFEKEDRQEYLTARFDSKEMFKVLSTAIHETRTAAGKDISNFHYSSPADAINRGLFGKTSKQIKEELGIGKEKLNRDYYNAAALKRIATVEEAAAVQIKRGVKAVEAVKSVIDFLGYEVMNYGN